MPHKTKLSAVLSALACLVGMGTAQADRASDAETLFNWAERVYSQYFPTHASTATSGPWLYRYYSASGVYVGLNENGGVYVMGGPFGNSPSYVDTSASLLRLATASSASGCSTADAPAGFSYSQSGNTVNVSTAGCVAPPAGAFCNAPTPASATGISVLGKTNVSSFSMGGFNILIPGFPNPFESVASQIANAKSCIRNAPEGFANLTVNMDVCYDITAQLGSSVVSIPGVLAVNPPITVAFKGSTVNQTVSDCFATDAAVVTDALTKEVWVKQGGTFVKIK